MPNDASKKQHEKATKYDLFAEQVMPGRNGLRMGRLPVP
jgi:hypothetical protein